MFAVKQCVKQRDFDAVAYVVDLVGVSCFADEFNGNTNVKDVDEVAGDLLVYTNFFTFL